MQGGLSDIGRTLLFVGLGIAVVGGLLLLGGKIPGLGRLPGDIVYRKGSFTFYFPLATSILLSLLLTLVLSLFRR
jgi:hypothetical protein